jgi:hypothetical protein
MTSTSILKRGARTVAQIFRDEVLNSCFSFKNVHLDDVSWGDYEKLYECNGWFPTMVGNWSDSFFAWKHYDNSDIFFPEYIGGDDYHNYIADGITKYWDGSEPKYSEHIKEWGENCKYYIDSSGGRWDSNGKWIYTEHQIPYEVCCPFDETPTDIMRREQYYIKHLCIWGLKDCDCSSTGVTCNKPQNDETLMFQGTRMYCMEETSEHVYSSDEEDEEEHLYISSSGMSGLEALDSSEKEWAKWNTEFNNHMLLKLTPVETLKIDELVEESDDDDEDGKWTWLKTRVQTKD